MMSEKKTVKFSFTPNPHTVSVIDCRNRHERSDLIIAVHCCKLECNMVDKKLRFYTTLLHTVIGKTGLERLGNGGIKERMGIARKKAFHLIGRLWLVKLFCDGQKHPTTCCLIIMLMLLIFTDSRVDYVLVSSFFC